jgi:hypothetical protein
MASRGGLLPLCSLCEKVYDKDRSVWMKLAEYDAYHDRLPDGYAFTGTFCEDCHKLYALMIGIHKKANHLDGLPGNHGIPTASAPDQQREVSHG